jgi:hypothetical protein
MHAFPEVSQICHHWVNPFGFHGVNQRILTDNASRNYSSGYEEISFFQLCSQVAWNYLSVRPSVRMEQLGRHLTHITKFYTGNFYGQASRKSYSRNSPPSNIPPFYRKTSNRTLKHAPVGLVTPQSFHCKIAHTLLYSLGYLMQSCYLKGWITSLRLQDTTPARCLTYVTSVVLQTGTTPIVLLKNDMNTRSNLVYAALLVTLICTLLRHVSAIILVYSHLSNSGYQTMEHECARTMAHVLNKINGDIPNFT